MNCHYIIQEDCGNYPVHGTEATELKCNRCKILWKCGKAEGSKVMVFPIIKTQALCYASNYPVTQSKIVLPMGWNT